MDPALAGLGDLLLGGFTAVIGLLALLLTLLRREKGEPLLAAFGAFALLYGARLVFGSELVVAMGVAQLTCHWVTNTITYLIGIPAWIFFWLLVGQGRRQLVRWWVGLVTVFAVVGILSDVIQGTPGTLARHPNNILVLAGLVVMVFVFASRREPMTTDLRILLAGLATFGLFAANDNLVSMGLVPWSFREEAFGFTIFMACLGTIAARRFFARESQLAVLENELETARKIQESLLPDAPPRRRGLSVAVRFQPTSAVAGDLYDFPTAGDRTLGVLVADVSGHGVPAALVASMVKVAVTSHAACAARPAEFLTRVNATLCQSMRSGFVTAACVHLDPEGGRATVGCAGHPAPLLLRAEDDEPLEVGGRGPILGRFPSASFEERTLPVAPGDRLLLYTDGLTEARDAAGSMFGEERLRAHLASERHRPGRELCDSLVEALRRWTGGRSALALDDDLTLVVVDLEHR